MPAPSPFKKKDLRLHHSSTPFLDFPPRWEVIKIYFPPFKKREGGSPNYYNYNYIYIYIYIYIYLKILKCIKTLLKDFSCLCFYLTYIYTYAKLLTCIIYLPSSFTWVMQLLWFIWKIVYIKVRKGVPVPPPLPPF